MAKTNKAKTMAFIYVIIIIVDNERKLSSLKVCYL